MPSSRRFRRAILLSLLIALAASVIGGVLECGFGSSSATMAVDAGADEPMVAACPDGVCATMRASTEPAPDANPLFPAGKPWIIALTIPAILLALLNLRSLQPFLRTPDWRPPGRPAALRFAVLRI